VPAVKVTTKTRRAPGAKRPTAKPSIESARIAVIGIPASGKTTYFRFLSGHFGLNLPILYIPSRADGEQLPLYGDLENDVALEETTYETTDPTDPEGSLETTTRYYVNRPMEDRRKLWVELSAGRDEQGVLTKYPLPTKFNQFVEMKLRFRYGAVGNNGGSRPLEMNTIDEAGGIIADYFTYDRLWLEDENDEVPEKNCKVIPHFDSWRPDRRDLWRRGLTLLGRFVHGADAIILLLSPALPSLRDQAQQVNLARGVFRYVKAHHDTPLVIAISKADKLKEFYTEVETSVRDRSYRSAFDPMEFLMRRDGAGMGTILVAQEGKGISVKEDVFLVSSAVSTGEGHPLFIGETGLEAPSIGAQTMGVPVMVNTTLPLARACERIFARRATAGS
jgi:hypothetical protein